MSDEAGASGADRPEALDVDAIPVQVVLEFGRIQFDVGELRRLAPGAILPLARPVDEAFEIVANGKRIGYGAPVRVSDSLSVRVTRLIADD